MREAKLYVKNKNSSILKKYLTSRFSASLRSTTFSENIISPKIAKQSEA